MKFLDLKGVQTLVSYANGEFFHSVSYDAVTITPSNVGVAKYSDLSVSVS